MLGRAPPEPVGFARAAEDAAEDGVLTARRQAISGLISSLREEAEEFWRTGGGEALLEAGSPSLEYEQHREAFCTKVLAEALHGILNQHLAEQARGPREAEERGPEEEEELDAREQLRRKDDLNEVRKKDSPDDDDAKGQEALACAQLVQRHLVETNLRGDKSQVLLAAASEFLPEARAWPAPEPSWKGEREGAHLYGNLYPHQPPVRQRCVVDGFASPEECRDICGHCVRGMHCMFRRGGQTSLAVSFELLERRLGEAGAEAVCDLVERTRARIVEDFGLAERMACEGRPVLFESGALLTRLQAKWARDMWEISGEEEHAYWNAHVDKANVASYDYAALLYLNSQGEHFEGGDFAFVDAQEDCLVAPRRGRLLTFTAGPENLHQVRRVTRGTRFVLAMWYTLSEKHRRKDK